MKTVTMCIVSRGRPASLVATIMSAWRLRSGDNDVHFMVGWDYEDSATYNALNVLWEEQIPVVEYAFRSHPDRDRDQGGRQWTRGDRCNEVLHRCIGADVVTVPGDRCLTIVPGWDAALTQACELFPTRAIWWSCPNNNGPVLPAWGRRLLDAMEWRWSSGIFPFWFDDTWTAEIDAMLNPGLPLLKSSATYAGHQDGGKTRRLRDLAFWYEVFARTRPMRALEAGGIAKRLGIPFRDPNLSDDCWQRFDRHGRDNAQRFEDIFGDPTWEPDAEYLEARASAAQLVGLPVP